MDKLSLKDLSAQLDEALGVWDEPGNEQPSAGISAFDDDGRPRKQADVLIDIGLQHDLFHDPGRTAFARVDRAVYPVESSAYKEILAEGFLCATGKGCNRNSLGDAVTTLASLAKFRGDCRPVWLRVGGNHSRVVIDTGRSDHALIEVTADGWRWLEYDRPMFRRVASTMALPDPAEPDFCRLWDYLTVTEEHRPLLAAFMLGALQPAGPYPILNFSGEQGTGKSTQTRVVRRLTDPSTSPLRPPPKDVRDLLVGALNGHVLAIDNLSGINPQLSDALCRLSTGGAISERALYSNTDEVLIEVQRPLILNGIENPASRADLAERTIDIELEPIAKRRTESEFWRSFEADAPYIFGGLLEGLSAAIRNHRNVNIGELPRMADFAQWAAAGIEPLGFTAEQFIEAYKNNITQGQTATVDSSPVGEAISRLMAKQETWSGTATDLMAALAQVADDAMTRSSGWPKSPRWMTGLVTRLAPALRLRGIEVRRERTAEQRLIVLCSSPNLSSLTSLASQPSPGNDANDANDARFQGSHISSGWEADL